MPIKVLHCPKNVGSQPSTLVKYEKQAGLDSVSYVYLNSSITSDSTNTIFKKDKGAIGNELQAWRFLLKEAKKYDVIHYNFGSTIVPVKRFGDPLNPRFPKFIHKGYERYRSTFEGWELKWLKKQGKKIFVTFQGDDVRIGSFQRDSYTISFADHPDYLKRALEIEEYNQRMAETFSKYAEKMYALNPDLLQTLPSKAEFLPYASVDINDWKYIGSDPSDVLKVVHAPTYRGIKGTEFVLEAVERLKSEGFAIELILIENMSRSEARRHYERADMGVDQLFCGWYGGLALELMSLGKPVVAYIREQDMKFVPQEMHDDLPIINATPRTIYDILKEYATFKKEALPELGKRSRAYAEKWHHPAVIAQRMKKDYENALMH
jgi:glycosyltransferase involved in cell wall biosynthesis